MLVWMGALGAVWALLIVVGAWARRLALRTDDGLELGLICRSVQVYCFVWHGLRVEGLEHAREAERLNAGGRPLIVAPNHTAGIDPLLVQVVIRVEIRWMMASDMRAPVLERFWRFMDVIFVDRSARDARSLRAALRHLKEGGTLGVFPEGHIERPPRVLMPFRPGIGLLVRSSGAVVLPVVIDGTPQIDPAWSSLTTRSRSTLRILEPVSYDGWEDTGAIVEDLRGRFAEVTGWPTTERAPILHNGLRLLIDIDGVYFDERTGERYSDERVAALVARAQEEEA